MKANFELALLEPSDREMCRGFDCGDNDLNDFLATDALRLQEQNVARTYLALEPGSGRVAGYCTLLSDSLHLLTKERKNLGLASADHPIVPAMKIARLGVSLPDHGKGAGQFLVLAAFAISREVAELTGCRLLTVDSYPGALSFYEKLGFTRNRSPNYRERENPSLRLDLFATASPEWV